MSYASILEREAFPETFILVEGEQGSIHLTHDCELRVTTREKTTSISAKPKLYSWADPEYALIHSSIVDCNQDILNALQKKSTAETTGKDNLETVRLVHASYASAKKGIAVNMKDF
jgi:predicted dehydrogenase